MSAQLAAVRLPGPNPPPRAHSAAIVLIPEPHRTPLSSCRPCPRPRLDPPPVGARGGGLQRGRRSV
eukprot:3567450-Pyramimonas_sp.AAC.1